MRGLVLALIFFTGFSGLVFQVVWQKYMAFLLGGEALASAMVVSIFLGGLAAGYALFGRWSLNKRVDQLIKMAGICEVGIGAWTFYFPSLFDLLWGRLDMLPVAQPARGIVDIGLTVLLLSPATVLMGSTLPLLTRGLAETKGDLPAIHARVYGVNTLGAFLGALGAGFYLIRAFGLPLTLMTMAMVNVVAGIAIFAAANRWTGRRSAVPDEREIPRALPARAMVLLFAFLVGAVSIGFEIIFMRSVSLALGSSEYSYAMVVGVFVLMIAAGSLSLPRDRGARRASLFANQVCIAAGLILVYFTVPYWGWLNYVVRNSLADIPSNFLVYHSAIFLVLALLISVPVFFMGRAMPLLFALLGAGNSRAAQAVGRIYSANTLGCCAGGILMGYLLLTRWDADAVFRFGIVLSVIAAALALRLCSLPKSVPPVRLAVFGLLAATFFLIPNWRRDIMPVGFYRMAYRADAFEQPSVFYHRMAGERAVVSYRDDPNMNVSVIRTPDGSSSLFVNGKSDGSDLESDERTVKLLAHLPALFAPEGEAAVVGLGLGGTAYAAASFTGISHVDVFEISEGVIRAQPFFTKLNRGITENPKVTIIQNDAFRGLMASRKRYSMVVSEPSNPWVSGVDRLFSREFYEIVKTKLAADGVFSQWIHTYEFSLPTLGMVLRTFSEAFPHVRIFRLDNSDLVLLGSEAPWTEQRLQEAEARWRREPAAEELAKFGLREFEDLAAMEMAFAEPVARSFEAHSLFFPKLSYAAGRDFFLRRSVDFSAHLGQHPVHHLAGRRNWANSLMRRALKGKKDFGRRMLEKCEFSGARRRPYAALSRQCRQMVLGFYLPANSAPAPDDKSLREAIGILRSLIQGEGITPGLSPAARASLLESYPDFMAPPPAEALKRWRGCELQGSSGPLKMAECGFGTIDDLIRFGHLEEARRMFEEVSRIEPNSPELATAHAEAGMTALRHLSQAFELQR